MKLEIKCKGADTCNVKELLDFQGDLKTLSDENYIKFKAELLELGFSEPISVWIDTNNKKYILNGHQRRKTILNMIEEGIDVPDLPINIVQADDIKQAKRKVLALTSQFGQMTQDGLEDFCQKAGFEMKEMLEDFRFPEVFEIKEEIDYSVLDGFGDEAIDDMADGVKKAITIEFEVDEYDEAYKLVNKYRNEGNDVGKILLDFLREWDGESKS